METSNMAYSLETSSVKTIVPGAEVSGFCDVVARQKINEVSGEVPQLSAGEGIDLSTVGGKTVITNNISAGDNISLVYDSVSNKIRIDCDITGDVGHTYTGVAPITVDNVNDQISISGESLSAGPGINIFGSGGYVIISAGSGDYNFFPITGSEGATAFTANIDCSGMYLTTGSGPAGGYVQQTVGGVKYASYPSTDVSASWYNIINAANNSSNCYCIKLVDTLTSVNLEDYSAYNKLTILHGNEYGPSYEIHWDGKTKEILVRNY